MKVPKSPNDSCCFIFELCRIIWEKWIPFIDNSILSTQFIVFFRNCLAFSVSVESETHLFDCLKTKNLIFFWKLMKKKRNIANQALIPQKILSKTCKVTSPSSYCNFYFSVELLATSQLSQKETFLFSKKKNLEKFWTITEKKDNQMQTWRSIEVRWPEIASDLVLLLHRQRFAA